MKHLSLTFLLLILFSLKSFSCSCYGDRGFCQTFQEDKSHLKVILGKVIKKYYHGRYVKVLEELHGNVTNDTILVWGDPGNLCRGSAGEPGDTMLLAINDSSPNGYHGDTQFEKLQDYEISSCGTYSMKFKNNMLTGYYSKPRSSGVEESINYSDFVKEFQNCSFISTYSLESGLNIYPNPSNTTIRFASFLKIRDYSLYDAVGKLIYSAKVDDTHHEIDSYQIGAANGLYFLVLNSFGNERVIRKIIFSR